MRLVLQRVSQARVLVEGTTIGEIGSGLLVLLGIGHGDTEDDARWLADKIAALRIFEDTGGKLDRSVVDTGGGILVVSQFTLLASTRKGTRPSFNEAAKADIAIPLYEAFVKYISAAMGKPAQTGRFGAMMSVELTNDGPVTLVIDSKDRE